MHHNAIFTINKKRGVKMWFIFALLTTLAWGSADLFYKKGSHPNDKFSHVKIVIMVGLIMGIHGL